MGNRTERGYRLLLVHKNDGVLEAVKDFFDDHTEDFSVFTSTTLEDAFEVAENERIDVVVGGSELEDTDSVELLKRVRGNSSADISFVLFLGEESKERTREAIDAGVTDYLMMTMEEFVASVEDPGQDQHDLLADRVRNIVDRERMRTNYREIFDKANDSIFVHDTDTGEILDVNRRMCERYGYTYEEALELDVDDVTTDGYTQEDAERKIEKAKNEGPQVFEWDSKTKGGNVFPAEISLKHATIGGEDRILAIVRDISERKEYESELERKNDLLRHAEDMVDVGGWELNTDTEELLWTDGTRETHDVPEDYEPTLEEAVEFHHPEDRDEIRSAVERCREEGEPFDKELRIVTAEDSLRWIRSRGEAVEEEGEVRMLRGAIQDITERKERERELERYEAFIENSSDVVTLVDENGEILYNSPSIEKALGYEHGELATEYAFDYVHPDDREEMAERFSSLVSGDIESASAQLRFRHADGSYVWFESVATDKTDTEVGGVVVNGRDISERKEQEKRLKESEERYRALVEQNLVGIYIVKDGVFEYVNPTAAELLGEEPEDMMGKSPLEYVPKEEDRKRMKENIRKREEGEVESIRYSFTAETENGEERILETHGTRIELVDGPAISGAMVDMTEDVEREKKLRTQKEFTEDALDAIQDMFVVVNSEGKMVERNRIFAETMGYEDEELEKMNVLDFFEGKDNAKVRVSISEVLETGSATVETDMIPKEGEKVTVRWKGSTLYHPEEGEVICAVGRLAD